MSAFFVLLSALYLVNCNAQDSETVTIRGTVYGNNEFKLWINGELVAEDPVPLIPHNAYNVSFEVAADQDITFGIDAIDWSGDTHGLEFDGRCLGGGGLRAMFDSGVVTNSSWTCWTYHYGPVNWNQCYALDDRNTTLKGFPGCTLDSTPPFDSCWSRVRDVPEAWAAPDFDDTHWENAIEWDEDYVGWGLRPPGCDDPNNVNYVSTQTDPDGVNLTCPEYLNWAAFGAEAQFIWRDDLHLDNRILCRYTLKQSAAKSSVSTIGGLAMLTLITIVILLLEF